MLTEQDLHEYQRDCVDHIMSRTHCALFLEMGLGKTVTTLTAINKLMYEELDIDKTLVIAPKRVAENVWTQEAQMWEHLKHLRIVVVTGSAKQRRRALLEKADIYVIGRDNTAWLCTQYGGGMLPFDMLVIDELSSFKNPQSVRFKALKNVQPSFSRVVGLTGTPAPNGLIDLWSQIYLLDRGERLGKFIGQYRNTYFTQAASNGHIVYRYALKGKEYEKEIHRKISDICISMKAKDYLELPETIVNPIYLNMSDQDLEAYNEFEKELVMELIDEMGGETEISVMHAGALSNKLLQFANGAVYDKSKNWHEIHDVKIQEVQEIIENSNSPVLIAWAFKHDEARLLQALKKYKPRPLKDTQDIIDWNNGDIKVLLMHPASGGHGLNLQHGGNNTVWFGQTWSLELYQQLNARLDRQGQTKPVILHKLLVKKTIDIDVAKAIDRKSGSQEALMQAVKARIAKYFP